VANALEMVALVRRDRPRSNEPEEGSALVRGEDETQHQNNESRDAAAIRSARSMLAGESWTQRIAGFATDPNLMALHNRVLLMTGPMTPLARQQLGANGWSVR
jgi:hypothetical protein